MAVTIAWRSCLLVCIGCLLVLVGGSMLGFLLFGIRCCNGGCCAFWFVVVNGFLVCGWSLVRLVLLYCCLDW